MLVDSMQQEAQEERDQAAIDLMQTQLLTTKNQLWKDVSWLSRKSYLYQNYNSRRGRSYAQIGTEDGYGYRRNPYEGQLHDKVKEMKQAF